MTEPIDPMRAAALGQAGALGRPRAQQHDGAWLTPVLTHVSIHRKVS